MRLALILAAIALAFARVCDAVPATHPGDILLTAYTGHIILFHPENGTWEDFASLSPFHKPSGIVREPSGNFLISDRSGAVLRLDATSGNVTIVSQNGAPNFLLYAPEDLVLGTDGYLYVLQDQDITRVDPATGTQFLVTPFHRLFGGSGMKLGADGKLYVANKVFAGLGIVWVDPATGDQAIVSQDGLVVSPCQLDFQQDGTLLVSNWDFSSSELLRVDPGTGAQTTVVAGIDTTSIPGMARDAQGGEYLTAVPWLSEFTTTTGKLLHFDGTSVSTMASFPFGVHAIYIFPGSSPVPTQTMTWGAIKGKYR